MRIVGGKLKSRRLLVSSGVKLRPTADKVKGSIFNMLTGEIEGRQVLDLFAGTGNLGIEAISRGAEEVIFVDSSIQSTRTIRANLESLGCLDCCEILRSDYRKAIGKLAQQGREFDLVFADPPYLLGYPQKIVACLLSEGILRKNALLVLEHHKKERLDIGSFDLIQLKQREFGDTTISILLKRK